MNRWNSTFKAQNRPVRQNPADFGTSEALIASPALNVRKRCGLKLGRKTKEWSAERVRLKKRFLAVGIITCELRGLMCTVDEFLTWAHTRKRRHVHDLSRVVLACQNCHWEAEKLGEAKMEPILEAVIAARKVQP